MSENSENEGAEAPSKRERRKGKPPLPKDLSECLNESQLSTLRQLENFGWDLIFVRRPLFQEPLPVLVHVESGEYAVLEEDGTLNHNPDITIR